MSQDKLLKAVLGEEAYEGLTKALEKLNTRSVVDIQELHAAMKTVPKAVMAFLIRELKPMEIHEAKEIKLPYHENALLLVNKDDADVYHGQITQDGKLVHDFDLASIPQLAAHLVSNYELYDQITDVGDIKEETTPIMEESSSSSIARRLGEAPAPQQDTASLKHDLIAEKIKTLEAKIDQIMMLMAQQKPEEDIKKSEKRAVLAKISKILSSKALTKAGLMPKMPKPPGPGVKVGGNQGITQAGFHSPKSAATDMPGHNIHTGVENPYLKAPKPDVSAPKQAKQPKQPKTPGVKSFAAKSESNISCKDCGGVLMKSGEYVGCSCFKSMSKPTLKKTESATTFTFDSDWDEETRFALWKTLRK